METGGGGGGGERRTNTRRHNSGRLAAGCGRVASDLTGFMENNYLSSALLHSNSARGIRRNFNRRDREGGGRQILTRGAEINELVKRFPAKRDAIRVNRTPPPPLFR